MLPGLGLEAAVARGRNDPPPARTVVQAMLAFAPEFDGRGPEPVTAPVCGTRQAQPGFLIVVGCREGIGRAESLGRIAQALLQDLP